MLELHTSEQAAPPLPAAWLYVPANRPALWAKALSSAAGALVIDLEDAVPAPEKPQARANLRQWLLERAQGQPAEDDPSIWVRIDPTYLTADLKTVMDGTAPLCDGVMLAKTGLDTMAQLEELTCGALPVVCLIESAAALRDLDEIARFASIATFGIGEVDLLADLRISRTATTTAAIDAVRLRIVASAAAGGLAAPIAPTSTDFKDLDTFATTTEKMRNLGFRSRTAIHPKQCPVINAVFTPDEEQITAARRIVELSDAAAGGVTLDDSGRLIDAAVVRESREILQRAGTADPQHSPDTPKRSY